MAREVLDIVHLYPKEMNIYGDNGNLQGIDWRLRTRGFTTRIHYVGVGDGFPSGTDIIVAGGGQDSGQTRVQADLKRKARTLRDMRDDGVVMLAICGMYQLLGHYFQTGGGVKIDGAGVLDAATFAGDERLIGNITIDSEYGRLVGFENHSGETELGSGILPLGKVVRGAGNSRAADFEGAISHNVFGTYLHGPIVPKNPRLGDELITRALNRRYGIDQLEQLDDSIAVAAAETHAKRPR